MVSFCRTHYRISLRRLFARGAYCPQGGGGALAPVAPLGYAPGRTIQVTFHYRDLLWPDLDLCLV